MKNGCVLPPSPFHGSFLSLNDLEPEMFKAWIIEEGMEFGTLKSWWGERKPRLVAHEGVDLCAFRLARGNVSRVSSSTRVPAIYGGVVEKVMSDFLGNTVIIETPLSHPRCGPLLAVYGHVIPESGLEPGRTVNAGDCIACVSPVPSSGGRPVSHLHITIGLSLRRAGIDLLDWNNIGNPAFVNLLDPLQVLGLPWQKP